MKEIAGDKLHRTRIDETGLVGQDPCRACNGSGWMARDPDIGTDQECFVCDGSGKDSVEAYAYEVTYANGDQELMYPTAVRYHIDSDVEHTLTPLFTHPTPDDASLEQRIPDGWKFYGADFSLVPGSVMLTRDTQWWLILSDDEREKTDLYVYGRGKTIEEALDAAIDRAMKQPEPPK